MIVDGAGPVVKPHAHQQLPGPVEQPLTRRARDRVRLASIAAHRPTPSQLRVERCNEDSSETFVGNGITVPDR